jgi:TolB-like protein/Flp pilus assembly protein TadD
MGAESAEPASTPTGAVFLSYASQDAKAALKICETLRAAGIEVWFDKSELRGGDVWDRQIRERIHDCRLFIAVISANSETRDEGYFRHEWKLSVERTHHMSDKKPFLVPVVIDDTPERGASVPDKFHEVQWTRLPRGETPPDFVDRVRRLLSPEPSHAPSIAQRSGSSVSGAPSAARMPPPTWWSRPAPLVLASVVITGGIYLALDRFVLSKRSAPAPAALADKSIAVLPFADLSEKHDQEYFSDGMAEEIIDLLSKIPDLRVPARTSSFYFKGRPEDIPTIARRLMVAHVLEGSVRKSGNRLRVTAQLVRADTGYHVWSQTFDRELDDVFKVQDEIAGAVVKSLKVSLVEAETPRAAPTTNTEAYTLYLQARAIEARATEADYAAAVRYLRQAVTLDPNFAAAWAAIASLLVDEFYWQRSRPYQEVRAEARKAADQALKLDPKLSSGHLATGKISFMEWDWNAAQAEFDRALELDPGNAEAMRWKSHLARYRHQVDLALQAAQEAVSHDPLDSWNFFVVGAALGATGKYPEAEAAYRTALELNPTGAGLHAFLGDVLRAKGEPTAALAETERETDALWRESFIPFVLEVLGRKGDADKALANFEEKYGAQYPFPIAAFHACRKDADRTFAWLDSVLRQHDLERISSRGACFKNLESDPRYKSFLRELNLPE